MRETHGNKTYEKLIEIHSPEITNNCLNYFELMCRNSELPGAGPACWATCCIRWGNTLLRNASGCRQGLASCFKNCD